jgi:hypothetical protein
MMPIILRIPELTVHRLLTRILQKLISQKQPTVLVFSKIQCNLAVTGGVNATILGAYEGPATPKVLSHCPDVTCSKFHFREYLSEMSHTCHLLLYCGCACLTRGISFYLSRC